MRIEPNSQEHRYAARLEWTGQVGPGPTEYATYGRSFRVRVQGKPELIGSADPVFRGDASKFNPEDLAASRHAVEPVEVVQGGVGAEALDHLDIAAAADLIDRAIAVESVFLLVVFLVRGGPVAQTERGGMRIGAGPER